MSKPNLHSSQIPSRNLWLWSKTLSGVDKLPEEPVISQDPSFLAMINSQIADTSICLPVISSHLFGSLSCFLMSIGRFFFLKNARVSPSKLPFSLQNWSSFSCVSLDGLKTNTPELKQSGQPGSGAADSSSLSKSSSIFDRTWIHQKKCYLLRHILFHLSCFHKSDVKKSDAKM